MTRIKWHFHSGYKWWEGSSGKGSLAIQGSRKTGRWYLMRVPWLGNPIVLGDFSTKEEAQRYAEKENL